jgi:cobalamin biosynthetic protein CobC
VVAGSVDHALVINPNNPTAEVLPAPQLQALHQRLVGNGGWLVVDEAFADVLPQISLAPLCPSPGLIVYRSVGKFFGLAGIRLGFLLAPASLCAELDAMMPPWLLSHPARWIGAAALADSTWQLAQQQRLHESAQAWLQMLCTALPRLRFTATPLFVSGRGEAAYCEALHRALARRAVLLRVFETIEGQNVLRFGLPLPAVREHVLQLICESAEECACELD